MTQSQDIIERLERASGSSFELNSAIARLDFYREAHGDLADNEVPDFCASIDAALTLVPEMHAWSLRRNCSSDGEVIYCNAQVWRFCDPRDDEVPRYWANSDERYPAIALSIAALKARASISSKEQVGS